MKYISIPELYTPDPDDTFTPVDLSQDYDDVENEAIHPKLSFDDAVAQSDRDDASHIREGRTV